SSSSNNIIWTNDQTLTGSTIMTAKLPNQTIQVTDGTLVQGDQLVWLKTTQYIQTGSGTGQILGNPLVVGAPGQAGFILNSGGNVLLPTNLTFVGQDLTILASGSIISAGLSTINLTGGFGGNLTMVAGFNFTPSTLGQIGPVMGTYTIGTPSTGGSINLPAVSINLSGTALPPNTAGGNLIAVAHGGSITLGSINTSSSAVGGSVSIIGQNGVTVGSINTVGSTASGQIAISAADPTTNGTVVLTDGSLISGSLEAIPGTFNNNIVLSGNINAGEALVSINTGGTGSISAPPGTSITAGELEMKAGTGGIGTPGAAIVTNAPFLSANSIGDVFLSSTAKLVGLLTSSGDFFQLTTTSPLSELGVIGLLSANDIVLQSTNNGSIFFNSQLRALNGGPSNSVVINANGSGQILDFLSGAPTISTNSLKLVSGTGTIGRPISGQFLTTNASTLSVSTQNTTAFRGVYVRNHNTGPVTITGLTSGSTNSTIDYLGFASALTVSGQVSGNIVKL
ncbi:MAG: hypothetical protein K2X36_08750, partial [Microbacteriaceae bacterium]|nr:hypothetical protein [Microbacteriaceae bacterium]